MFKIIIQGIERYIYQPTGRSKRRVNPTLREAENCAKEWMRKGYQVQLLWRP